MTIAVLAAMGMEAARLAERIEDAKPETIGGKKFLRGKIGEAQVVLHRCGMGMRRADQGARALMAGCAPDALVLCGVSGGLLPNIRVGETFIAVASFAASGKANRAGLAEATDAALADAAARALGEARKAPVATSQGLIVRKKRKARLVVQSGAVCCDMESYAVAKAANETGVPLLVLRTISDTFQSSSLLAFFKNGALAAEKAAADTREVIRALARSGGEAEP